MGGGKGARTPGISRMRRRLEELRQIIYSEKDRETESLTEKYLARCSKQVWQRKPNGNYGGGVRWRGGVDPRQFYSWGGSWEVAFLDPLFFSVFVGSNVY